MKRIIKNLKNRGWLNNHQFREETIFSNYTPAGKLKNDIIMRKTEADFRYCIAQSDYGVIVLENGKQYAFPHHEYISAVVFKDVISFNIYYTDCARQYLEENEFNGNFRNMPEIKSVYVEVKDTRIYFFRMPRLKKQDSR